MLLSLDDDVDGKDAEAAAKDSSTVAETSTVESVSTSSGAVVPLPWLDWDVHSESQVFVISSKAPPFISTPIKRPVAWKKTRAASPSTPSPSSASSSLFHRRKSPRKVSIASVFEQDSHQITSSVRFTGSSSSTTVNGEDPEGDFGSEDEDADAFRFWSGGSREEINREPWKIQSWLLHGLKQKVEHSDST